HFRRSIAHSGVQASAIFASDGALRCPQVRAPAVCFLLGQAERLPARELQSATPSVRDLHSTVLGFAILAASGISIALASAVASRGSLSQISTMTSTISSPFLLSSLSAVRSSAVSVAVLVSAVSVSASAVLI